MLLQRIEHLGRALRVAHVGELVESSGLAHIVDLSRGIVITHLDPAEVPEFLGLRRESGVAWIQAVRSAALVSKPDIVAFLQKLEGRCEVRVVHNPAVSTIGDSML